MCVECRPTGPYNGLIICNMSTLDLQTIFESQQATAPPKTRNK